MGEAKEESGQYSGDPDEAVFWKQMASSVLSDGGEV